VYFHVNLNVSKFNKKLRLLVSEQYIDSLTFLHLLDLYHTLQKFVFEFLLDQHF